MISRASPMPIVAPAKLTLRTVAAIGDIDGPAWDRLAGTDNPTLSHAFLHAIETSGSATAETGWQPVHLLAEDATGALVGAVPLYLKSHSWGEYIFDQSWADAYSRVGGHYYPKLLAAVPFTPVPGIRLLVMPEQSEAIRGALIQGLIAVAENFNVSSLHINFLSAAEALLCEEAGFLRRFNYQFHWHNKSYSDFGRFLDDLASRKRKAMRKERLGAMGEGIEIETLTGAAIKPDHWEAFYRCYIAISDRKWGYPYLTRDFFHKIGAIMPEKVVLVMASQNSRYIAGALNLLGRDALYGRNWGTISEVPLLHFEACYYRAIDFAIERGLKRVEAGAQGEHKLARGYLPVETYSVHWIRDKRLRAPIAAYLTHERSTIIEDIAALRAASPFRQEEAGPCEMIEPLPCV